MIQLLVKQYVRSRGLMIGLMLLFISGLVSIYIGKLFLERQANTIDTTSIVQKEQIVRHLEHADSHIGLLLYYIRFGLANETPALSGLAIGHRDIRLPAQLVNIRNLEEQKNAQELVNPLYQLLGNMDLSFVIIYLFPLIIIGIGFNLVSEERESGVWSLIKSQPIDCKEIFKKKLLIRFVSVLLVLLLLLVVGMIYLHIPVDQSFLLFMSLSFIYIIFWFSYIWFVTSFQLSSNQNALILLSTWIILTIIAPASLNNVITNLYPVPEAYSTTIESREGYHSKWDLPKEPTITKFKETYPEFEQYNHPDDQDFSWFWYYAMQHMGDDESRSYVRAMKEKLQMRDRVSRVVGYIMPSIHTQLSMNTTSRSDMTNYLNYIEALEAFHEKTRLYFYPKIFQNTPVDQEDWQAFSLEFFRDQRQVNWMLLLPLFGMSLSLIIIANPRWNKNLMR